eukprot:GGOE01006641.1.p2 GENE.GGOE01006641.1~~GGOE01006641.1.p2  ORF type:complete len:129 (-),score=6.51 GGOE01006641.1:92-478(-)
MPLHISPQRPIVGFVLPSCGSRPSSSDWPLVPRMQDNSLPPSLPSLDGGCLHLVHVSLLLAAAVTIVFSTAPLPLPQRVCLDAFRGIVSRDCPQGGEGQPGSSPPCDVLRCTVWCFEGIATHAFTGKH